MMDRQHNLSLTRQSSLLGIGRGSYYYQPRPISKTDLALMRRMDELHMDFPFAGSRMLKGLLRQEGLEPPLVFRRLITSCHATISNVFSFA